MAPRVSVESITQERVKRSVRVPLWSARAGADRIGLRTGSIHLTGACQGSPGLIANSHHAHPGAYTLARPAVFGSTRALAAP